jgi:hypothetical protein
MNSCVEVGPGKFRLRASGIGLRKEAKRKHTTNGLAEVRQHRVVYKGGNLFV